MAFYVAAQGEEAQSRQQWIEHHIGTAGKGTHFEAVIRLLHPWLTEGGAWAAISWHERAEQERVALTSEVRSLDFDHLAPGCSAGRANSTWRPSFT